MGLRRRWRDPLQITLEVRIRRKGYLQISRQNLEDPGHVCCALDVGVTAQRIYAAASAPYVSQHQLKHGGGADDLRAKGVLRPPYGINNRCRLLQDRKSTRLNS